MSIILFILGAYEQVGFITVISLKGIGRVYFFLLVLNFWVYFLITD